MEPISLASIPPAGSIIFNFFLVFLVVGVAVAWALRKALIEEFHLRSGPVIDLQHRVRDAILDLRLVTINQTYLPARVILHVSREVWRMIGPFAAEFVEELRRSVLVDEPVASRTDTIVYRVAGRDFGTGIRVQGGGELKIEIVVDDHKHGSWFAVSTPIPDAPKAAATRPPRASADLPTPSLGRRTGNTVAMRGPVHSEVPCYQLRSLDDEDDATVDQAALVGSTDVCSIRLKNPTVGGEHAQLDATTVGLLVRDLASLNGTKIDNTPVDSTRSMVASPGQVIAFGASRFEVHLADKETTDA